MTPKPQGSAVRDVPHHHLRRLDHWLSARNRWQIVVLGTALLAGISVGDYYSRAAFLVALVYFVPIAVATWYGGRGVGVSLAVVSAAACTAARTEAVGWSWAGPLPYVNGLVQMLAFVAILLVVAALHDSYERARDLALSDPLTGLANRRAFRERAVQQLEVSRRSSAPLALAYLDLDDFKAVNDTYGHERGDRLLVEVAAGLSGAVRASDIVARFGGDEFCILLPGSDAVAARMIAEKLAAAVTPLCRHAVPDGGVSIGVAVFAAAPADVEALLVAADRALYSIKRRGRGGIVVESVDTEGRVIESVVEDGHDSVPRPAQTVAADA